MVSTTKTPHEKGCKKALRTKASPGEYLAFLSVKYEVDPDEFFHALVTAEKNQKSKCGNLSIECRGKTRDKVIFLIQIDSKVVAQFPIPEDFLLRQDSPIKDFTKTDMIQKHLDKKNARLRSHLIRDLRSGMKQVNLKARVLEIPRPKLVFTRFGNYASVANALIADETGTVRLCLWNEQIDSIAIGDTIQVQNARMSTFRGERQLNIGKNGTVSSVKDINPQLIEVQSS
jgi:replication factor A1